MHRHAQKVFLALVLFGSSHQVSAQTYFESPNKLFPFLPGAEVGDLLVADFTGDLLADVLCQVDGKLTFLFGPAYFSWSYPIDVEVQKFVMTRNGSVNPHREAAIYCNDQGLHELWFDYGAEAYQGIPGYTVHGGYLVSHVLNDSEDWSTVIKLMINPRDEIQELVAIRPDSLLIVDDLFGDAEATVLSHSYTQIVDSTFVNWDGLAPIDIAIISELGTDVITFNGLPLYRHPAPFESGRIAPIRPPNTDQEDLVVIGRILGDSQDLFNVLSHDGSLITSFPLGSVFARDFVVEDFNGDSLEDVVSLHDLAINPQAFEHQSGPIPFTLSESSSVNLDLGAPPSPANPGGVSLSDMDKDGDMDLVTTVDPVDHCVISFGQSKDRDQHRILAAGPSDSPMADYSVEPEDATGYLMLPYTPPQTTPIGLAPTDIEVVIWLQPTISSLIQGEAIQEPQYVPWNPSQTLLNIHIDGETESKTDKIFWIQVRQVSRNLDGKVVQSGPLSFFGLTTSALTSEYLFNLHGVQIELSIDDRTGGNGGLTPVDDPGDFDNPPKPSPALGN